MQKKLLLIDTNILIAAAEGFDLFGQLAEYADCEPTILEGTIRELESLTKAGKGKEKAAARLALALAREQSLNIAPQSVNHVDTALLETARARPSCIATQDRELQLRALAEGICVLTIRKRSLLRPVES